jgi:hypothetical protein
MRAHHDLGGLPAGPLDLSEHVHAPWEKRTHALVWLLNRHGIMTVDELRRGIESLSAAEYDQLGYYERWITSITQTLLQKGVLTVDDLGRKLAEIESREVQPS